MAINKSVSSEWLTKHVTVYTGTMSIGLLPAIGSFSGFFIFFIITFLAHFVTDYITSREVRRLFNKKDFHNGFVVIGLDQILHYTQILLTLAFVNR